MGQGLLFDVDRRENLNPTGMAGRMGGGPENETCGSCRHRVLVEWNGKRFPKCNLMREHWRDGGAFSISDANFACRHWQAKPIEKPTAETRREAANANAKNRETQIRRILELIAKSESGLACHEIAALMQVTPNRISGRFTKLSTGTEPMIEPTGEKRLTASGSRAVVWQLTAAGRKAVQS